MATAQLMAITSVAGAAITIALLLIAAAACIFLYFLPSVIARSRRHHNAVSIFILNLLLGWTFIGWVVALVMAFSNPPPTRLPDDRL
jgi:hypothetical protein